MKAVVFSGTTEGRGFSRQLAALGAEVLVSVATPLGAEEQGKADGISVHCGRLTTEEMTTLLQGAALCVDATHPYAVDATKNIRAACAVVGVEYHRLLREESPLPAGSMLTILSDGTPCSCCSFSMIILRTVDFPQRRTPVNTFTKGVSV